MRVVCMFGGGVLEVKVWNSKNYIGHAFCHLWGLEAFVCVVLTYPEVRHRGVGLGGNEAESRVEVEAFRPFCL